MIKTLVWRNNNNFLNLCVSRSVEPKKQKTLKDQVTQITTSFECPRSSQAYFDDESLRVLRSRIWNFLTKPVITYTKLTIETLKQGVKYVES